MTSQEYKAKKTKYFWISFLVMLFTLGFYVAVGFTKGDHATDDSDKDIKEVITKVISLSLTAVLLLLAMVVISNKLRTTVWMVTCVIGTLVMGRYALIATFFIWAIDEYWFYRLYNKYKLDQEIAKVRDE